MTFFVYILKCGDGSYYTGHTNDLEKRLAQHEAGVLADYSSSRHPLTPVWSREFSTREEALRCERQIKGWSRARKEALMRGDWAEITRLAKSKDKEH